MRALAVVLGLSAGSAIGWCACIDQSVPTSAGGGYGELTNPDALPGPAACTNVAPEDLDASPALLPYTWKNAQIIGGGFVTGIVFSPVAPGLIYARTDVGGAYRWDSAGMKWTPITDWIGASETNLVGIESIAADPVDPNVVYLAAGEYTTAGNGKVLRSADQGTSWSAFDIPVPMGGNANGRSMGERLAVDPHFPSTLFFASRTQGLWTSTDSAQTWNSVSKFPTNGDSTYGLSFVLFDARSGANGAATPTLYVGATPVPSATPATSTLYRSMDGGMSWQPVPGAPLGLFAHHAAMDSNGVMYLSMNDGPGPNGITMGAIWKFDTTSGQWTNISPPTPHGGYGGVSVDASHPGTLVVTSLDRWPDEIYRSTNAGSNWTALGPNAVRDVAGAEWLYWHGSSPTATGWMGDVRIDPFDSTRALYITGQGLWWSDDLTNADKVDGGTHWAFRDLGIEQTVALGLISPSLGAPLLSAVGDLGGFRHDNLNLSPDGGMFANPIFGNTTSLDFAETHPSLVVRVGTSSASANTTGHGAYSVDGGSTWVPFANEPGGSPSAGSVAVSSDGVTFVWAPQGAGAAYSRDWGNSWTPCNRLPKGADVASDRANPAKFYATQGGELYVSSDGGATFAGTYSLGGQGAPRPVTRREGDLFVALGGGLYHSTDSGASFSRLSSVETAVAIGFGRSAACTGYPVLYLSGGVGNEAGIFRSDDQGASWREIDDQEHRFGWIAYVSGDPRSYGRVYLGSGGRGILYGDPQ